MNKKLLFNHLLYQYNKSIGKLKRLSEKGLNFRRQTILGKRIERIKRQLISIKYALTKALVVCSFAGGVSMLQPEIANAQNFQPPVVNPFSLTLASEGTNNIKSADYADIDADGDIDIIVYSSSLDKLALIKNIGTPQIPEFGEPELIPVSLVGIETLNKISLGDLDLDGDFDLMAGGYYGNFIYFENVGSDSLLIYTDANINPFALDNIGLFNDGDADGDGDNNNYGYSDFGYFIGENFPVMVDIDADGDLDIFTNGIFLSAHFGYYGYYGYYNFYGKLYIQNTGNNEDANFIEGVFTNALNNGYGIRGIDFGDLDSDSDLDIINGLNGNIIRYTENNGSDISPSFYDSKINTFGLSTAIALDTTSIFNSLFCPSLVDFDNDNDLDLIFLRSPNEFYLFENEVCDSVSTTIIDSNEVLMVEQNAEEYQWFYQENYFDVIPQIILNGTDQIYTPITTGYYNAQVFTGNCSFSTETILKYTCESLILNQEINFYNNQIYVYYYPNVLYQWLDCNNEFSPILYEFNTSYNPTFESTFAVQITNGYCVDTTDCYDFNFCDNVPIEISLTSNTLTALVDSVEYHWRNCNNIYQDLSNSQDFSPTATGAYFVNILIGNCEYNSDCIDFTNCNTISDNIITNGNTLTVQEANCNYQWIQCDSLNSVILGATNITFTPAFNGSYAAIITVDNCTITTECINVTITNINNFESTNKLAIVPNPTNGNLNVSAASPLLNAVVQIKSIAGQIVAEQNNISGSSFVFDLSNHANGLYLLEVTDGGFTTRLKIVKE